MKLKDKKKLLLKENEEEFSKVLKEEMTELLEK